MININNVTKFYKVGDHKNYVLKNATLTIPDNESVGVLGLNGAGKSTLIRMLGGTDYPNNGTITSTNSISWPLGLSNGFQTSLTGAENVKFVCRIHSTNRVAMKEKVAFVKEFSELKDYFDMPVNTYSSGMKSRLAFGLSMAFDFDIYLIDEILSVGDKNFKKKCQAMIMVSHDIVNMREMCTAGIILRDGNLEYFNKIEDAISKYNEAV
jgi:capsular polysaccharide transport system ATP-binding protein